MKERIVTYVDEEIRKKIKTEAEKNNKSESEMLSDIIHFYFNFADKENAIFKILREILYTGTITRKAALFNVKDEIDIEKVKQSTKTEIEKVFKDIF